MAWIETIDPNDAPDELSAVYDEVIAARGKLSNILRVHSLNPDALQEHLALYDTLLFGQSGLRRAEREALATVVSAENGCDYCIRHHAEALNAYWNDKERIDELIESYESADLTERLRAILDYGVRLTRDPNSITEADINALREAGLEEEEILNVNLITSYFNFVNRVAEGLGVRFTEEEATGYEY